VIRGAGDDVILAALARAGKAGIDCRWAGRTPSSLSHELN